jgi:hypothetical protein
MPQTADTSASTTPQGRESINLQLGGQTYTIDAPAGLSDDEVIQKAVAADPDFARAYGNRKNPAAQPGAFQAMPGGPTLNANTLGATPIQYASPAAAISGAKARVGMPDFPAQVQAEKNKLAGNLPTIGATAAGIAGGGPVGMGLGAAAGSLAEPLVSGRKPTDTGLQDAAITGVGTGVGAYALGKAGEFAGDLISKGGLPSAARAGAALNEVKQTAGGVPIDTTGPGRVALEIKDLSTKGGQLPKVVRDFVNYTTDPKKPPLTFADARDFYSNATRLSSDEFNKMSPTTKYKLGEFVNELGKANADAAGKVGLQPKFEGAIQQYHSAMEMQRFGQALMQNAKRYLPWVGGAVALHELSSKIPSLP